MRKYFFGKKLEEGILIKRPCRVLPSVIANGTEIDVSCPLPEVFAKRMECGIPCLVGKNGTECRIYAISLNHAEDAEKNWVCISAELIERAIGFFLENHQMEELNASYGHVTRNAVLRQAKVDFLAGDFIMDVKCSFAGLGTVCIGWKKDRGLMPDAWQILKYINIMNSPDYDGKRAIFLLILQKGLDDGQPQPVPSGILYETIKTMLCMGIEFWTAILEVDAEGIRLVSCRNIDELILSGKPEKD